MIKYAWFPRDSEQEKEKASSLMEKVAPIYYVNSRASMALSISMESLLNINKFQHKAFHRLNVTENIIHTVFMKNTSYGKYYIQKLS